MYLKGVRDEGKRRFIKFAVTAPLVTPLILDGLSADANAQVPIEYLNLDIENLEWVPSTCIICGQGCPLKIGVINVDGERRIFQETYNYDPDDPKYFAICARPRALGELPNHPDRIKSPMIRTGDRGSGEFEPISWDEALDILADEIRRYLDKPEKILVFAHQGGDKALLTEFFKLVGTPNITKHADTCYVSSSKGRWFVFGKDISPGAVYPDYENARYVVLMGRNPYGGFVSTPWAKSFSMGVSNGMRIVVFDVRYCEVCSLAEKYFIIKPGTDLAVSLSILRHLLVNNMVDRDYLVRYTNAPMLVYRDDLKPVEIFEENGKIKDFIVYDEADGGYKFISEAESPAIFYEGDYEGREVATVLSIIRESVKDYTPEWASSISGVDPDDIVEIAENLYKWAPRSFIDHGYKTVRYYNEPMWHRVNALVNAVIGSIGRVGGWAWPRKVKPKLPIKFKPRDVLSIPSYWEKNGYPLIDKKSYSMLAIKSILEGKPYRPEMVVVYLENLVSHIPSSSKVVEALLKTRFNVQFNTIWDETSPYMDLILPIPFFFETDAISLKGASKANIGQVSVFMKAVDPPPDVDVKPTPWIVYQLVKRLFPEELEKFEIFLNPREVWRWQCEKLGIDYEKLVRYGALKTYSSPDYNPLTRKGKLPTKTGRIELINVDAVSKFSDNIGREHNLNPLPIWIEPLWMKDGLAEDEFVPVDYMVNLSAINTWARNTRLLVEMIKWLEEDTVKINSRRASELGIRDGDMIKIVNPETGDELVVKVRTTRLVAEEVIAGAHGLNPGVHERGVVRFTYMPKHGLNTNLLAPFYIIDGFGSSAMFDYKVRFVEVVG